jgi:hypothetical protein
VAHCHRGASLFASAGIFFIIEGHERFLLCAQLLLRALMGGWRAALAQPRLPFHVVQLPGYKCATPQWIPLLLLLLQEARPGCTRITAHPPSAPVLCSCWPWRQRADQPLQCRLSH